MPCPPPGDLPHPGTEAVSPALAGGFFTAEPPGKPGFLSVHTHTRTPNKHKRVPEDVAGELCPKDKKNHPGSV